MRLIINADDYGYNPNCTRAITECLRKGWITNTTLMVTMPDCEEALDQAKSGGFLNRIGLHLNLYGGKPLTDKIKHCPRFCDEEGGFNHQFCNGLKQCWTPLSAIESDALGMEVSAQCARYIELGLPVRHLDSHHHSHLHPCVLPIVSVVAKAYGFQTMRRGLNAHSRQPIKRSIYNHLLCNYQSRIIRAHDFTLTRYMTDFEGFKFNFDQFEENDTVELMVHPFYAISGILDETGEMSDSGLRSMSDVVEFVERRASHIEKISYADIPR